MVPAAAMPGDRLVRVLAADPDLAQHLPSASKAEALAGCRARAVTLPEGPWTPADALDGDSAVGVLVLEGLMIRDVLLGATRCSELLGRGDVVEPRDRWPDGRLVSVDVEWTVVEEMTVAVLDEAFTAAAARWPEVLAALFERASERSFRLGIHVAICQLGRVDQRVQALLWHLAERWGRVASEGVVVPLPLSHATLGRLVGAQRPTVSLALKELALRGSVTRRSDGTFLLLGTLPTQLDGSPQPG